LYPETELNRHSPCGEQDFKSGVSTNSTIRVSSKQKIQTASNLEILYGAEDRARTGHPDLGKVVLYQMSYFRMFFKELYPLKEPLFFRWDCKDSNCFQKTKLF
jgi:hypothetical protein